MHTIYQVDGQGKDSYEVANGSVATYWYGHAFELNGTRYFTSFTWDTRERYGKPGEDDAGPDTQVNLAEATYTLTGSTPDKPWQFRGMTNTIGNFGAYEKPEFVDPKRKPVEYRTPAGKLVLAVPTDGFDNGTSFTGYALFVFNPGPRDELKDKVWTYVGSVNTGSDNSAACADGDVMPCVSSQGELSFAAHGGSDMPRISIKVSGTTITGRARPASSARPTLSPTTTTRPARSTPASKRHRRRGRSVPRRPTRKTGWASPAMPIPSLHPPRQNAVLQSAVLPVAERA